MVGKERRRCPCAWKRRHGSSDTKFKRQRGSFYFLAEQEAIVNRSFRRKTVAIGGSFRCFEVLLEYFPFFLSPSLSFFLFILSFFFFSEREPIFSRVFSTTVPVEFLTVFPLSAEFSTGGACYRWGSR